VPSDLGEDEVKIDGVTNGEVSAIELHEWLQRSAPRYMVPRYIELRDSFPKTPSERVEKYKLAQQTLDRPEVFDSAANQT
jgi:crotonobetaine/carnitine-CoA ligase